METGHEIGWKAAAVSVQGRTHRDMERPCEDFSMVFSGDEWLCAVVADGHGSRKHFRSRIGAEMACTAVRQTLENLTPQEQPETIKKEIVNTWRTQVQQHLASTPWTEEELEEQQSLLNEEAFARLESGETAEIAYGTTLIFAVVTQGGWLAMQLGDGGILLADENGVCSFPIPEDAENCGCYTASLAMNNPMEAFRHCEGTTSPALIALYTDGVEKAFPRRSLTLTQFLHKAYSAAGDEQTLTSCAAEIAESSCVKDDVSIALLMKEEVCVPPPNETSEQRQLTLQRLQATVLECEGTLTYLQRVAAEQEHGSDAEMHLLSIIERKQNELSAMKASIENL